MSTLNCLNFLLVLRFTYVYFDLTLDTKLVNTFLIVFILLFSINKLDRVVRTYKMYKKSDAGAL